VAEVKEAGAIAIRYGLFMNSLIKFLLTAFALFLIVKAMNKFKKAEEPAAPAEPPAEEKLLTEIRDLLANKQG
jgi:large conductance mechanosensitive channel